MKGSLHTLDLREKLKQDFVASIDRKELTEAYHQQRYGHRLLDYSNIVFKVGKQCLRSWNGDIYHFDGRIWNCLSDSELRVMQYSLSDALVACKVDKDDVVKSIQKLYNSLCDGAKSSVLELSPSIVGFRNGIWDFSDIDNPVKYGFGEKMPVIRLLDYDYDPNATCPKWISFLKGILPDDHILTLQKYMGLACVYRRKMTHRVEESLWLVGTGANGKSTITNVITDVVGCWNVCNVALADLVSGNMDSRARLIGEQVVGKIFNICDEVQAYDITRYEDAFKSLCSGSPQTTRTIKGKFETKADIPFLIFSMNNKPTNSNMDRAMLRRLIFIPFRASVTAKDMDRELGSSLRNEYSGIRNWLIEGYKKLVKDDFRFTKAKMSDDEKRKYMVENRQTIRLFMNEKGLRENYHINQLDEKPKRVLANVFYAEYAKWCRENDYVAEEANAFYKWMNRTLSESQIHRVSLGVVYSIFCDHDLEYQI